MIGTSTARSDEPENASGRLCSEEETIEGWQGPPHSLDDFVTTERAELRRGYASATSLAIGIDSSTQKRQKRASIGYGEATR